MSKLAKRQGSTADGVVPAVCSAVLPGLGQLVNGESDKAIGVAVVAGGAYLLSGLPLVGTVAGLALVGTWLYGVADGYFTGKKKG